MSLEYNLPLSIHNYTRVLHGRKSFGDYDHLVETGATTKTIQRSSGSTDLAMVIPVMDRTEKVSRLFEYMYPALGMLGIDTHIVLMDNSINKGLENLMLSQYTRTAPDNVTSFTYHHDPRMIQSGARNYATKILEPHADMFGIWDCDIYPQQYSIRKVLETWRWHNELIAIAPPLGSSDKISSAAIGTIERRRQLHMPGGVGEDLGVWNGDILRTTMMRGAFFANGTVVDIFSSVNYNQKAWLEPFVVWQNVPFFVGARELGLDFGYVMDPEAMVMHDDAVDEVSVGYSLPMRTPETLKALVMLMHRNRIYEDKYRQINTRFWNFNTEAIRRVTGMEAITSNQLQSHMVDIARALDETQTRSEFGQRVGELNCSMPRIYSDLLRPVSELLAEDFVEVRNILSFDPARTMYSV